MMDTILNLGLNEDVVAVLSEKSGNPRWAWDCYRRFIQMYSDVVMEVGKKYFEQLIDEDAPMSEVLPSIYNAYEEKYRGYTIRRLSQEMHDFYKDRKVSTLQKQLFLADYFPEYVMNPQEAQFEYMRGHGDLVDLTEAEGRIALEGALPYPPGVLCVHPGERWSKTAVTYFLDLVEGINQLPGFAPEIQGVYVQTGEDGLKHAYGYVLKKEFEK